ncbi:MAG: mannosyltransferase family protein [Acidimicrobiales bacterium]
MLDTETAAPLTRHRRWRLLGEATSASCLPWLTCRCIVLAALALARYEVSHLDITQPKAVSHAHAGLLGWDAGWYADIAAHGYDAVGRSGLRFFPLFPLVASLVHHVTFLPVGGATVLLSNAFAFGATVGVYLLARSEFGDAGVARTAVWLFNLVPAAFSMVMGYSDSLLVLLAVGCFYCLRHRWWLPAAALGLLAGTARPIGCLLLLPALCEAVRDVAEVGWRERTARLAAVVGPVAGLLAYLSWASVEFGGFIQPLTVQDNPTLHGRLTDPVVTLYHDGINLLHGHHVGTDLHLPWIILAAVLAVVAFRRLPASYGLFAVAVMAASISGSNLDSFERYALSAFPLLLGAATLLRSRRIEITVLVLCAVSMFGYALLAFLGAYVP